MAQDDLRRELGFWDALTIGAGTMIGAGIFLLAGVALELTGPAAIFSYLAAGIVCMITAASAAELATGMPTSGGDYFFVSRSLGPALGAISGVGIWLSLTFAISFYLFGLGEYLSQFLPLTPFWGAFAGGLLLTAINVYGAKESGQMQVIVVLTLMGILGAFCGIGAFYIEWSNFTPFFPFGGAPVASTTALVFVSFLGFVKIAAVAEEIKNPAKNLPRTLIGSVALVTLLYVVILLVIGGIFEQETIGEVRDPLTQAARTLAGPIGAGAIIFAGLLATVSSANASIMASSRINLAMARDRMVPNWLSAIHETLLTPHRAILLTGVLALAFLFIESLEQLAKIASVLQLYSYAALNVGCVALRVAQPDWYEPSYRTPGFPFAQGLAALACIGIILYSGPFAQIAIVVLILASLGWYYVWGRSRVEIEHAVPEFREQWAAQGWSALAAPAPEFAVQVPEVLSAAERAVDADGPRRVSVALANPEHEHDLLQLGRYIATGQTEGGHVAGIHLVDVPLQTPLRSARAQFTERPSLERAIADLAQEAAARPSTNDLDHTPLEATDIESVIDVAHDVFGGLIDETQAQTSDMLLMGWQGGFNVGRIYNSPIQRIVSDLPADLGVLKDRGFDPVDQILLPWGGGLHAQLGLEIAVRVARITDATVHLLRVVREDVDVEDEKAALDDTVQGLVDTDRVEYLVRQSDSVTGGIDATLTEADYDFAIIGASREWSLRQVLFGSIPDVVADRADCSVLMVRRYVPNTLSVRAVEGVKRLKETVGLTTSPEE
ncbi:amino acid transporter/nucleotide-binding universal stress UspA family protein [Salinibacter ruber]|uniref:amino acid permease n=1 Tax=Salinibacter ruber TaxID=146919 RepID=UPI0021692466|nr:amino acid permease [Salinibacter ruber]MCS4178136.1 amino acid transporter/nucleotide-binding universal stress UspA family protein [Salinibacter ruber]